MNGQSYNCRFIMWRVMFVTNGQYCAAIVDNCGEWHNTTEAKVEKMGLGDWGN